MSGKIVVTGLGVISALGIGVEKNTNALLEGHSGIASIQYLKTRLCDQFVLGEVKYSNEELKALLGIRPDELVSRTALLAFMAGREAIEMSTLSSEEIKSCALISGTTVGGMDLTESSGLIIIQKRNCVKY